MADQSDVEQALVGAVAGALYPAGPDKASATGALCRVFRGWPAPASLASDLANGVVNVSVFPAGSERNTTRWLDEWITLTPTTPTLTVAAAGETITFGGTAEVGQLAGVLFDQLGVIYRTQPSDTPSLVAANIAGAIRGSRIAQLSGVTVTVPGSHRLIGRVVADQPALWQTRRQAQAFRVTLWCPDFASRDASATTVDAALAQLHWLVLPDGSAGRMVFVRSEVTDSSETAGLYRRDLIYDIEYATTLAANLPRMLFGEAAVDSGGVTLLTLLS